ncbi:[FeFe] hydrogenase H-cluster radical SAM maturase HydE [Oleispirillum naphthae]|uniref:[FeFe] hydrogenase H-cluster radical SAM maturase HydE n=1 Tax=Oleispirillum naphthae TaxID=2838853 RepID=UPI0030824D8B
MGEREHEADSEPLQPLPSAAEAETVLRLPRARLFAWADGVRRARMGDAVFLRGIVEVSNVCANDCLYCGIRRSNAAVRRYRIGAEEVFAVARRMADWGMGTIVLQCGERPSPAGDRDLGTLIARIKAETPLAVTVSAGNRPRAVYAHWRDCGMDRYLLRFETSDAEVFARVHPDCTLAERLRCLADLRGLGVQVGSGFLIGLPGETLSRLAANILLCRDLDLDMIGIGPFIAHPGTPMAGAENAYAGDAEMPFVALAALRLFNPDAHIPATTAFDAAFPGRGRDLALRRGANVYMPNVTPQAYRGDYLLYPGKPCVDEAASVCAQSVPARIRALGRGLGAGRGDSFKKGGRAAAECGEVRCPE